MGILVDSGDKIQMVNGTTAAFDVHASYYDHAAGPPVVVSPVAADSEFTTAATNDIVASPSSGMRNVQTLHVMNVHGSTSSLVTIQHFNGTLTIILWRGTLAAGESVAYTEGQGFVPYDANGIPKKQATPLPSGSAITAQIASFSADTYLAGASLNITNRIQAGSFFRWYLVASKGGGTATPTFIIRTGTAGAIGDTARLTMTGPAQTAVADTARIRVEATFRVVGASAVLRGDVQISHNLAATGFAATGPAGEAHFGGTSGTFDVTPAGTIIGLSVNPGASGAWVVEQATLDAVNLLS